ncbi:hypothetical protein B0T14DRAFT_341640 [Immersiella caudata]|uniref:Uncharacterized protein n=1 Tax=Immersiella caudata TaxID=314043 RepID=A0AA39T234_9PEZI|nr:hypothetical protein B0T14DRAFT_341640 [Immersiella caudata]
MNPRTTRAHDISLFTCRTWLHLLSHPNHIQNCLVHLNQSKNAKPTQRSLPARPPPQSIQYPFYPPRHQTANSTRRTPPQSSQRHRHVQQLQPASAPKLPPCTFSP